MLEESVRHQPTSLPICQCISVSRQDSPYLEPYSIRQVYLNPSATEAKLLFDHQLVPKTELITYCFCLIIGTHNRR